VTTVTRTTGAGAPPPAPEGTAPPGRPSATPARALARLLAAVAVIAAVMIALGLAPLLVFIVAVIVIVMVHELGHFATAKWSRMKVTEYFVGFGPPIWSTRRGETEYGVKPILLGGYVKIPGMTMMEEIDAADEPRTYRQQPFWKRIVVGSAGSFMHFVMAFVLAYVAVVAFGAPTSNVSTTVAAFETWSGHARTAAQAAGFHVGDVLVSVDGVKVDRADSVTRLVASSPGKALRVTVDRAGRIVHLVVTPAAGHHSATGEKELLGAGTGKEKTVGLIGVALDRQYTLGRQNPLRAVDTAGVAIGRSVSTIVRVLPGAIGNVYDEIVHPSTAKMTTRPESLVGAGRTFTQAYQAGIYDVLYLLILLNIGFALLNMVPMLPFDGGHVAIAVYEWIRTRRGREYYHADVAKLLPVVYAIFAVVMVFVVALVYLDVAHPIANPFR
jgi:membrane-associated protease RseP (regulator of RpoE activity)